MQRLPKKNENKIQEMQLKTTLEMTPPHHPA
jgi:hypothetical protein